MNGCLHFFATKYIGFIYILEYLNTSLVGRQPGSGHLCRVENCSFLGFLNTQQTVSVNICSEDLLSPTIFGLNCAGKTGVFSSSNFRDMKKAMPVDFGEIKMSFWVRKKAS